MSLDWQVSTPEKEGLDSSILNQVDDYIRQKRYRLINSVLVLKNGKIVFERYYNKYNENSRNNIKSIWKSILSIAAGICLDRGIIQSLDEPIGKYLQEFARNNHPYHKLITIRHLLTMSSGIYWNGGIHYHCPMIAQMMRTNDWITHISDIEMNNVPGMYFQYKEWDVMLLSAVIGRACGATAYDFTKEYLYKPLNISSGRWPQSPCGFSYTVMKGEEESDLSARDLAKLGMLFLDHGKYNGNQIVSMKYVKETITPSVTNASIGSLSDNDAYGFLWWLFPDGYGCRGFGGQEVNVFPDKHFVSIIQATPTSSSKSYEDINETILRQAIL
ncbi:CubicO group peptidase (beta-lactamase class C family) [Fontibacillus phaseoli]|uniref:CubicO group peptidase (Beta-lactamase class C family) n=1 Tax=Fontibacillus phaseoli TaxID=1416533 RepID=A0A369BT62_9BACL|nr:serine hydrolase [Fontibacillus phaseoli]RCX23766.1 CubicO group peptidase (beta-lactamase class C family) [Fontibacillus phaseoli]